jgi:hypothetical protein
MELMGESRWRTAVSARKIRTERQKEQKEEGSSKRRRSILGIKHSTTSFD